MFPQEWFEWMRACSGTPGREAPMNAPRFACHQSTDERVLTCAGWLAAVGWYHLGVRMDVAVERIPPDALEAGSDWPRLYSCHDEMQAAKAGVTSAEPTGAGKSATG